MGIVHCSMDIRVHMAKIPKKTEKTQKTAKNAKNSSNADTVLIKKYPNRRLYNTDTSSYIVLEDIVELIKSDAEFAIQDTKTGEDITREILNQIIYEQEIKPGNHHFTLELQKQLISMYGDTYGAMVPDYLTQSMELFVSERSKMAEAVTEAMGDVVGRNTKMMMDISERMARQNMELFKRSWNMFGALSGSSKTQKDGSQDPAPESATSKARENELEEIQRKIDALQNRLKSLK